MTPEQTAALNEALEIEEHGPIGDNVRAVVSRLIEEATVSLRNEIDRMRDDGACNDCEALTDRVASERDAALAEVERLRVWKESAIAVLGQWDDVFNALPADVRDAPVYLGESKAVITLAYIQRARDAEAAVARVEALCDDAETPRTTWAGTPLRRILSPKDVRKALRGDAT